MNAQLPGRSTVHERPHGLRDQARYICMIPEALQRVEDLLIDIAVLYLDKNDVIGCQASTTGIRKRL